MPLFGQMWKPTAYLAVDRAGVITNQVQQQTLYMTYAECAAAESWVPARIARAEWPNLAVTAFAHELAGAEQRLEMVGPLLIGKGRTGRADVKGDVRKGTPGQSRWASPLQSPAHGLRSASAVSGGTV